MISFFFIRVLALVATLLLSFCVSSAPSFVLAQFFSSASHEQQIPTASENHQRTEEQDQIQQDVLADLTSSSAFKRYPAGLVPTRIQTGKVVKSILFSDDSSSKNSKSELVKQQQQQKQPASHYIWVPFSPPFNSENNCPHVFVALSEFATEHQGHLRIRASATFINNSGFEMTLGSWTEPAVPHIAASWIASDLPSWEFQTHRDEQHLKEIEWAVTQVQFNPPLVDLMFDDAETFSSSGSERTKTHEQQQHQNLKNGAAASRPVFVSDEVGSEAGETDLDKKRRKLLQAVASLRPPRVVSAIAKFEQRGDAHWTKLDVQALSATALGFTSVIRPWGDAPTFWVAAEHLATTLPPQYFRTGTFVVPRSSSAKDDGASSTISRSKSESSGSREAVNNNTKFLGRSFIDFTVLDGDTALEVAPPMICHHPHVVVFVKCFDQAPPKRAIRATPQSISSTSFELFYDLRGASDSAQTKFTWIAVC